MLREAIFESSAFSWSGAMGVKLARGLPARSRTYTTPPTYFEASCEARAYWLKPATSSIPPAPKPRPS